MAKSILSGLYSAGAASANVAATLLQSAEPLAEAVQYTAESISEDIPTVVDRGIEQARIHGGNFYRAISEMGAKTEAKQKDRFERRYGSQEPTHAQMVQKLIERRRNKHAKKEEKKLFEQKEVEQLRQQVEQLTKLVEQLKKPAS